jgi:hypothetical protein
MLSGVHAAPGRQVSTWVHAVKAEESARVGGLAILPPAWVRLPFPILREFHGALRSTSAYPHASLKTETVKPSCVSFLRSPTHPVTA